MPRRGIETDTNSAPNIVSVFDYGEHDGIDVPKSPSIPPPS